MVVWKEKQHEDDDARAGAYAASIAALWGCGLLKLFHAQSMISCKITGVHFVDVEPGTTIF